MKCAECGTQLPEDSAYCGECGSRVGTATGVGPATRICPRCETHAGEDDQFCGECGTRLAGADGESQTGTKPPPPETLDAMRKMVLVPEGTFRMGSPANCGKPDEHPQHEVFVGAFHMDQFLVTNQEYERFDPEHRKMRDKCSSADDEPVIYVARLQAVNYANWRCVQEGVPMGTYRIPTETEWEKAARGGTDGATWPWGEKWDRNRCNSVESRVGRTTAVTSYPSNAYGLFDMAGNVSEWCLDRYAPQYYADPAASKPDPMGPKPAHATGSVVIRGGSWEDKSTCELRCAERDQAAEAIGYNTVGFRCVRPVNPPEDVGSTPWPGFLFR